MPLPHRPLRQRLPSASLADGQCFHVLLQIEVEEFEDEVKLVAVGVYDVEEANNGGVVHLFEQGDLADRGRGNAFIFGFETDFLEGDDALVGGGEIAGFVDDSVCAWRLQ